MTIRLSYTEAAHWSRASASQVKTSDLAYKLICALRGRDPNALPKGKKTHAPRHPGCNWSLSRCGLRLWWESKDGTVTCKKCRREVT